MVSLYYPNFSGTLLGLPYVLWYITLHRFHQTQQNIEQKFHVRRIFDVPLLDILQLPHLQMPKHPNLPPATAHPPQTRLQPDPPLPARPHVLLPFVLPVPPRILPKQQFFPWGALRWNLIHRSDLNLIASTKPLKFRSWQC
jgi:hypothetical protein